MKKDLLKIIFTAIIISFLTTTIFAQTKVGTTAASFLEFGVGSAASGMGNAYTGISEDVSAIYWNPARIAYLNSVQFMFLHNPWLVGISYNFLGAVLPVENVGVLGFGITILNSGDIEETTMEYQEGTGAYYNATDVALQFTYARKVVDEFSFGFSGKYISQRISTMKASALAADLGLYVVTPFFENKSRNIKGIQIGTSISNYGQKMKLGGEDTFIAVDPDPNTSGNNDKIPADYRMSKYNLPLNFRIGLAYDFFNTTFHRLTLAADAVHPNNFSEYVNVGGQYQLKFWKSMQVDLRAGYKTLFVDDNTQGLTFGFGFLYDLYGTKFKFDYAYSQMNVLGVTNNYTISFAF